MSTIQRNFHTDPGHGWLAVPLEELEVLGVAKDISTYSYFKAGIVYLEEDCDAGIYLDAVKRAGYEVAVVERNVNKSSCIRNYGSFHPEIYA